MSKRARIASAAAPGLPISKSLEIVVAAGVCRSMIGTSPSILAILVEDTGFYAGHVDRYGHEPSKTRTNGSSPMPRNDRWPQLHAHLGLGSWR